MPDPYPVVGIQEEWLLDEPEEEMGSKRKFWYREEDGSDWLFKFPRPNTGEHWAEKIAAEVANLLGIPHAPVELARFGNDRGSTSESFTPKGYELVHGNQLLERVVFDYNPDVTFGQSDHTLENVLAVMERVFVADEAKKRAKLRVADYFVLDALIVTMRTGGSSGVEMAISGGAASHHPLTTPPRSAGSSLMNADARTWYGMR